MSEWVLVAHALATAMMAGLIWFVQVVHYPMFALVGPESFARYEAVHQRRTTWVVGPLMLAELTTAVWIAFDPRGGGALAWAGLGLLGVIWISTALVQVPRHRRLERGLDEAVVRSLVRTNRVRTVAWTARAVIALLLLVG